MKRVFIISVPLFLVLSALYLYSSYQSEVPILYPESATFKIKPKNEGGIKILGSDKLVYNMFNKDDKSAGSSNHENINFKRNLEKPINIKSTNEEQMDIFTMHLEQKTTAQNYGDIEISSTQSTKKNFFPEQVLDRTKHWIKLGLVQSTNSGRDLWRGVAEKYSAFIPEEVGARFEKITTPNDRIFYYLLAGPFESFDHAMRLCNKLKQNNEYCIIYYFDQ